MTLIPSFELSKCRGLLRCLSVFLVSLALLLQSLVFMPIPAQHVKAAPVPASQASSPAQPYIIGDVSTNNFAPSFASLFAFATGTIKAEPKADNEIVETNVEHVASSEVFDFVSVSGRVLTTDGRGLRNALVTITDQQGQSRSTTTSSFGNYVFTDVSAPGVYTIIPASKLYSFAPQQVNVTANLTGVDFTALSAGKAFLRLQSGNATGGTNLYSRNFGWGTPLVGLPGRAGLDAGFGISYNSLVWLKDAAANEIIYDPDTSNVSPGFRMGFPSIEDAYYDAAKGAWVFLLVAPDGSRTDFRQVSNGNTFEAGDSSYRQLTINNTSYLQSQRTLIDTTVTSTDGMRMHYVWNNGAYRCYEVKDRNGNYISIDYDSYGKMTSVTDTLGRVITVTYDTAGYPTAVTQTWKDNNGQGPNTIPHIWATLSYANATVATNFGSLIVRGPANNTTVKVLDTITYSDGSSTKFDYNGYVQVTKISNLAADNTSQAPHVLNYVSTDLDSVSESQPDCPRFGATRSWVENFNLDAQGVAQPVTVTNSAPASSSYNGPNGSETTSMVSVAMTGDPDNHYTRVHYGPSGYKEGLTLATEDCTDTSPTLACTTRVRWTWNSLTQDNTSLGYILNPRVTETRVGDGTNTKRTTIDYGSNAYGLPEKVKIYDTDLSTVLKTQTTAYNLSSTYTSRRVIGLPSENKLWQGVDGTGGTLISKVTYTYDEGNMTGTDPVQNISPVGHDNTNYSSSFVTGRALPTTVTSWDATAPTTSGSAISTTMKYNTAGALVSKTSPWDGTNTRTVKIDYADNWNAAGNPTTYAYPTRVYNPAGNYSQVKYRYDIGASIEATSPAPAGQSYGKTAKTLFDSIGRPDRQSIYVNTTEKFYTRYAYPTNGIESQTYTTVIDTPGSTAGPDSSDEVLTESWFDGAGRVRSSRTELPGSIGGWSASLTEYDILGRVKRQSVPTEVSVATPYDPDHWTPAGDDNRGVDVNNKPVWLWNSQEYDWKGRVTREINTDGTDKLISYEGCGCAGGQVTTMSSELVPRDDQPTVMARRTQKVYADIQGRTYKTEVLNWDGSVYTTAINTFDGGDHITLSRQYAGTISSSTYQDSIATFDGFGRPLTTHGPQQDAGKNTTFSYYPDGSLQSTTDARGASATYTYNNEGLVGRIDYAMSGASSNRPCGPDDGCDPTPTPTPDDPTPTPTPTPTPHPTPTPLPVSLDSSVTFDYDNIGNRVQMTDSMGTVNYSYDEMSRLMGESRHFSGDYVGSDLQSAPGGTGVFNIAYGYDLAGSLKTITDPYGQSTTYTQNKIGETEAIVGSQFAGENHVYATNTRYRAWGAVKSIDYTNNAGTSTESFTYNNRLLPQSYELYNSTHSVTLTQKQYEYNSDGMMRYSKDGDPNGSGTMFDRSYKFDNMERLTDARTGQEARGGATPSPSARPYALQNQYNAFGNTTATTVNQWSTAAPTTGQNYTNNRAAGYGYDADGRITGSNGMQIQYSYTASGNQYLIDHGGAYQQYRWFDGEGHLSKEQISSWVTDNDYPNGYNRPADEAKYYIRSSLMGGDVISEARRDGTKDTTYVYGFGKVIGMQKVLYYQVVGVDPGITPHPSIKWSYSDISRASVRDTVQSATDPTTGERHELDPLNNDVGLSAPVAPDPPYFPGDDGYPHYGSNYGGGNCTVDGVETDCGMVMGMLNNGSGVQCPDNYCGVTTELNHNTGQWGLQSPFTTGPNGNGGRWSYETGGGNGYNDDGSIFFEQGQGITGSHFVPSSYTGGNFGGYDDDYAMNSDPRSFGPSPDPDPVDDDPTPCARMAQRAQKIANEAIAWAQKEGKTWNDALSMFDLSFTPYYIGTIWKSTANVQYLRNTKGGVPTSKRLPQDYGQQDFKDEYLDAEATRFEPATDSWGNAVNGFRPDQVHHFVGHFSAGINKAALSSSLQELGDWWGDNPGDTALTEAAYNIGRDLAKDPEKQLGSIGTTIKTAICR